MGVGLRREVGGQAGLMQRPGRKEALPQELTLDSSLSNPIIWKLCWPCSQSTCVQGLTTFAQGHPGAANGWGSGVVATGFEAERQELSRRSHPQRGEDGTKSFKPAKDLDQAGRGISKASWRRRGRLPEEQRGRSRFVL